MNNINNNNYILYGTKSHSQNNSKCSRSHSRSYVSYKNRRTYQIAHHKQMHEMYDARTHTRTHMHTCARTLTHTHTQYTHTAPHRHTYVCIHTKKADPLLIHAKISNNTKYTLIP